MGALSLVSFFFEDLLLRFFVIVAVGDERVMDGTMSDMLIDGVVDDNNTVDGCFANLFCNAMCCMLGVVTVIMSAVVVSWKATGCVSNVALSVSCV